MKKDKKIATKQSKKLPAKRTTPKKKAEKAPVKKVDYKKEWQGMPEFIQPDAGPYKQVLVSFADPEAMHKFAKLIGQPLTKQTASVWYPAVPPEIVIDKRFTDGDTVGKKVKSKK